MNGCAEVKGNMYLPRDAETIAITVFQNVVLTFQRDWGHARDYVECMWKMLQVGLLALKLMI